MLKITERPINNVKILDLEGNVILGGGSAALRDATRRLLDAGEKRILVNFENVKYIDSSGIGELVSASVSASRAAAQLKLCCLSQRVSEVMSLSSVLSIFEVFGSEQEAIGEFE
jgi:anti-sigma B factor antagonist